MLLEKMTLLWPARKTALCPVLMHSKPIAITKVTRKKRETFYCLKYVATPREAYTTRAISGGKKTIKYKKKQKQEQRTEDPHNIRQPQSFSAAPRKTLIFSTVISLWLQPLIGKVFLLASISPINKVELQEKLLCQGGVAALSHFDATVFGIWI